MEIAFMWIMFACTVPSLVGCKQFTVYASFCLCEFKFGKMCADKWIQELSHHTDTHIITQPLPLAPPILSHAHTGERRVVGSGCHPSAELDLDGQLLARCLPLRPFFSLVCRSERCWQQMSRHVMVAVEL